MDLTIFRLVLISSAVGMDILMLSIALISTNTWMQAVGTVTGSDIGITLVLIIIGLI